MRMFSNSLSLMNFFFASLLMQCQRSHFCSVDVCIWMPILIVVASVSESDCCN